MTPAVVINALLLLGVFVLLAYAMGRRPGPLTLSLAVSLIASLVAIRMVGKPDTLAVLLAIDAAVVAYMAHLARTAPPKISDTARIVMAIGTLKIVFAIAAVALELPHNVRAAARNGAFVMQIIVAGGMADGLISWLGHRAGIARMGARRMFHRVEGE